MPGIDGDRFDTLVRSLASPRTRRGLLGSVAALAAGPLGARATDAQQVTQAQCGNKVCAANPGVCASGCVCCVYGNGNSRCRPPGECSGTVVSPTTTTTAAPSCAGAACEGSGQGTCCAGVASKGASAVSRTGCTPGVPDPAPACVASAECCQNSGRTITCQSDGRYCASLAAHCDGGEECCSGVRDLDARACVTCLGEGVSCTFSQGACCAGLACVGDPGSQRCQPT